jgi:hypothetical protein
MRGRVRKALLGILALAVFGAGAWWLAGRRPALRGNLTITGPPTVYRWACKEFSAKLAPSVPKVPPSAWIHATPGAISAVVECKPAKTPNDVGVDAAMKSARFYFTSPSDGMAALTAKATAGATQSYTGTRNVQVEPGRFVPACIWPLPTPQPFPGCPAKCAQAKLFPLDGVHYVGIPYEKPGGASGYGGCCPAGYSISTNVPSPEHKLICEKQ